MPGIFALQLANERPDGATIADRLAAAMTLFPWQTPRIEEVVADRLFLGVVEDRDRSSGAAGCHARQGDVSCVVEGHIVRSRSECGAAALLARGDYARAALLAYASHGPGFAEHLEGQYGILLADRGAMRLIACHGRLGEKPLYIARPNDSMLFCSQLGPMATCGLWSPEIDPEAVATFLAYGQQFGSRTLLRDVEIMETASYWQVDLRSGEARHRRYWTLAQAGPLEEHKSHAQHVNEVVDEVLAAAERTFRRPGRYVTGLSGGADTRIMAGLAAQFNPDLVAGWTMGASDSSDLVSAAEVARHLNLEHWAYVARPDLVAEYADEYIATSDGSLPADWAFANARARELRERGAEIVLIGYAGECFMRGDFLTLRLNNFKPYARHRLRRGPPAPHPAIERNHGDAAVALYIAAKYGQRGPLSRLCSLDPPNIRELILGDLEGIYGGMPPSAQVDEWILEQRGRRRTLVSTNSDRHFYSDGSIFYDYDLLDRCTVVPPGRKRFNRLFNDVLDRLFPELGRMVSGNTGMPMTAPYWRFATREFFNRVLMGRQRDLGTGIDVDDWVRTDLREFYGDVLHDERARSRPFWDGNALAELYDQHQSGAVNIGTDLGMPLTVEVFTRRWIDPPMIAQPTTAERIVS